MKIKLAKPTVNDLNNLRPPTLNPEETNASNRKGIVFQSQYNSIQNYFTLLHHIFGRNSETKHLLSSIAKNDDESDSYLKLQIKDIRDESNDTNKIEMNSKSSLQAIAPSPKRSNYSCTRYDIHRPKWKQSILRRKNNGSHGEIFKGNPKSKYSSLVKRATPAEITKTEELPKHRDKLAGQSFVPLGHMYTDCSKNIISFKSLNSDRDDSKQTVKFSMKGRPKKKQTLTRRDYKPKLQCKPQSENVIMSKTCIPMKFSQEIYENNSYLRRAVISTPYRYKSRMSTPCPWQYTSQR